MTNIVKVLPHKVVPESGPSTRLKADVPMSLGLVGTGQIFRDGYGPAIEFLRIPTVLFDTDRRVLTQTCDGALGSELYTLASSLAELVGLSSRIVVCVPPAALEAVVSNISQAATPGLELLLEKPLGVSAAVSSAMQRVASCAGVRLLYMESFLHSTAIDVLIEEAQTGRLGTVTKVELAFNGNPPNDLAAVWRGSRDTGGEVLHDWGVHSLGLLAFLSRKLGFDVLDQEHMTVRDTEWLEGGSDKILGSVRVESRGLAVEQSVLVSWTKRSAYDLLVSFSSGRYLGIQVVKVDGSSSWKAVELGPGMSETGALAIGRYRKELFVRGLSKFASGRIDERFDYSIGQTAIALADEAYAQSRNELTRSS